MFAFASDKNQYNEILEKCLLTDRQKQILSYKIRGWYNVEIAAELGYSERTIRREVKEIQRRIELA